MDALGDLALPDEDFLPPLVVIGAPGVGYPTTRQTISMSRMAATSRRT